MFSVCNIAKITKIVLYFLTSNMTNILNVFGVFLSFFSLQNGLKQRLIMCLSLVLTGICDALFIARVNLGKIV